MAGRWLSAFFLVCALGAIAFDQQAENSFLAEWLPDKSCLTPLAPGVYELRHPELKERALEGPVGRYNEIALPEATSKAAETAAANFQAAIALMKDGRLNEAEEKLLFHVGARPNDSEGWRQLGDCRYNLGKVAEAFGAYNLALKNNADNYLARRGLGVACLYLGYEFANAGNQRQAHRMFQRALTALHTCLQMLEEDQLANYAQALAAEGVSRELYRVARESINTDEHETAVTVIRNCLDIVDTAVDATVKRLQNKPADDDARLLLSSLLLRRARILLPFGHFAEAAENIDRASGLVEPLANSQSPRTSAAKEQLALCQALLAQCRN